MSPVPDSAQRVETIAEARWDVWTTQAHLIVTDPAALPAAKSIARHRLSEVDRAASRFRTDSEVSRLARTGSDGDPVSPLLAGLLRAALDAASATDGDVDPTLGNALLQLGYSGDSDAPGQVAGVRRRKAYNWRCIRLQGDRLWLARGLLLDLGATAKAHTADHVAEAISERLGVGVLVSLGGDLRIAGDRTPEAGWVIQVQDGPTQPSVTIRLAGARSLATSSTLHRTWRQGRRSLHHVLDPATCRPAPRVWRTATVAADSCLRANTISTACLVRGMRAPAMLADTGLAARLVAADGTVSNFGGFPA